MTNHLRRGALALFSAIALASCGGGGGGSAPSSPPPPAADTTPPDTTYTTATLAVTASNSSTFNLTSTEAGSTFEASLDGGNFATVASPYILSSVADGAHTLRMRARDAAGNTDATPATFTWTVDSTAPVASIQFPPVQGHTDAATITVRGTASDAGSTVASIRVAGVLATADTANFATWYAQIPLTAGINDIAVSATDALGNSRDNAASAHITRGGATLGLLGGMVFDAPRNRVLVSDITGQAIYSIPAAGGGAQLVYDPTRGTGPTFDASITLDVSGTGTVLYGAKTITDQLLALDVVSGNRTVLSPSSSQNETKLGYGGLACNNPCTTLYAMSLDLQLPPQSTLFSIDISTGARTPISGGSFGSGPQFANPAGLVYDTSAGAPYPRVFLSNAGSSAVYEINLQTGARALISQAGTRGAGPALLTVAQMRPDPSTGQLIVLDCDRSGSSSGCDGRLLLVDPATGDRTQIVGSTQDVSLSEASTFAMDPTPGQIRLFLNSDDGARIAKVDYSALSRPLTVFYDVAVGSGTRLAYSSALSIEAGAATPSLLLTSLKPGPQIVRVDLATGDRSTVSVNGPNSGTPLSNPLILGPDTRAAAPANRLLVLDFGSGGKRRVVSVDKANGTRSQVMPPVISSQFHESYPLDAPGNRLLAWRRDTMTPTFLLEGVDLDSGTSTLITGIGRGTGPTLPSEVTSVGILEAAGAARRFLLADADDRLISIDPATGDRTVMSQFGAVSGPWSPDYDRMAVDTARQRVFLTDRFNGAVLRIDLPVGNRTLISGIDRQDGVVRGTGARFASPANPSASDYDPSAQVLYVVGAGRAVIAIDAVTGDRVVVSR